MITWNILSLQDSCNPIIEELIFFHDFTIVVLVFTVSIVGCFIELRALNKLLDKNLLQGQVVECLWTSLPVLVLVQVAVPSLLILYVIDDRAHCGLSIKVIGHQWYWSYEYRDFWSNKIHAPVSIDSFILPTREREMELFRLLDVDNRAVAPFSTTIRLLVGSYDVLHSWTVPVLGVKVDASPGRLNQVKLFRHRPGVFYGQCSEICGANHRFMPICLEFVSSLDFLTWVNTYEV